MISKELVSEVLGFKVEYVEECEHRDNIIGVWSDINSIPIVEINIHELAHKCKEWSSRQKEKDYLLKSYFNGIKWVASSMNIYLSQPYFESDSEPEAIFKACEWILDNK